MKLGFLTELVNSPDDINDSNKSKYGEFSMLPITSNHPDNIYQEIKEEDSFSYYMEWNNGYETNTYIFFKPWDAVEPVLGDESLQIIYIINDDKSIKLFKRENLMQVIHNAESNLALAVIGGVNNAYIS